MTPARPAPDDPAAATDDPGALPEHAAAELELVYLNGCVLPVGDARISPGERGLLLADGLFETMWARGGRIIRLPRHAARLAAGARALRLPPAPDAAAIARAAAALLAARRLDGATRDAALRLTYTRGPGGRGLEGDAPSRPTLLISAQPLARPPCTWPPATAILSRHPVAAGPLTRHKTLAYSAAVVSRLEARAAGADLALRPNARGRLAGADSGTLWLLHDERLCTPPLGEGAVAGTARAALLGLARGVGLRPQVRPLVISELWQADALLFSNALVGLREVAAVDGRPVGGATGNGGAPGQAGGQGGRGGRPSSSRSPETDARVAALKAALAADDCDCPPAG